MSNERTLNRPAAMELRVAINGLHQYSAMKSESERVRLLALLLVDEVENKANRLERITTDILDVLSSIENDDLKIPKYFWDKIQESVTKARESLRNEVGV